MTAPDWATLDPRDETAWNEFGTLAHRILDDALRYQRGLRDGPAWRPLSDEAKAALRRPLPRDGVGPDAAYHEFLTHILPYSYGNPHPASGVGSTGRALRS